MINLMYLVLTALLALNVSAEILNAFKTITRSLESSNKVIDDNTKAVFSSFAIKKAKEQANQSVVKYEALATTAMSETKVLLENKINILSGTIETDKITQRANDTFYLVDHEGNMFGSTKKAEEIRNQILKPLFNQ